MECDESDTHTSRTHISTYIRSMDPAFAPFRPRNTTHRSMPTLPASAPAMYRSTALPWVTRPPTTFASASFSIVAPPATSLRLPSAWTVTPSSMPVKRAAMMAFCAWKLGADASAGDAWAWSMVLGSEALAVVVVS